MRPRQCPRFSTRCSISTTTTSIADADRRHTFLKGRHSHDYKFTSAVWEDYQVMAPAVRDRYLAASVFNLKGSGDADNGLVQRIRVALGS